jgi:hypothetical protein
MSANAFVVNEVIYIASFIEPRRKTP